MQKRLDIACSLIHDPEILILDEPTQDLDPILRKEVLSLIKKINEKGTTVIITSHLLGEIDYLCENIAIINNGRIVKMKSLEELEDDYSKNKTMALEIASKKYDNFLKILRKNKEVDQLTIEGNRLLVHTPNPDKVLPMVFDIIKKDREKIISFSINKPTLEEVFESIVKE